MIIHFCREYHEACFNSGGEFWILFLPVRLRGLRGILCDRVGESGVMGHSRTEVRLWGRSLHFSGLGAGGSFSRGTVDLLDAGRQDLRRGKGRAGWTCPLDRVLGMFCLKRGRLDSQYS